MRMRGITKGDRWKASIGACRSTPGVRLQRGDPSSRFTSEALCDSVCAWRPLLIRSRPIWPPRTR